MKKVAVLILLIMALSYTSVSAFVPYDGYAYDRFNRPVPSANGFYPVDNIYCDIEKKVFFNTPTDMVIDEEGNFYITDSENNRIVIFDKQFKLVRILNEFIDADNSKHSINKPRGIYHRAGVLYIADTDNNRVIISDVYGKIIKIINKPTNEIYPKESSFTPLKITVDSVGNIYVIVLGLFQGTASFNREYEFVEFYGSNRVVGTAELLSDLLWKKFLTKSQKEKLARYVPVEFTGFDMDKDDFMYTCTGQNYSSTGEIRKLNPVGNNVWSPNENYGDKSLAYNKGTVIDTKFYDVAVTDDNFLFALDEQRCKIFEYDQEGSLVFVFGSKGNALGTFSRPVAVDTYNEKVFVLDSSNNSITSFKKTQYGLIAHKAIIQFNEGLYEDSKKLWEQVIKFNANHYLGYVGVGKALYYTGNYKRAMEYFSLGNDKRSESNAYNAYRREIVRAFIPIAIALLIVLLISVYIINHFLKIRLKKGDEI